MRSHQFFHLLEEKLKEPLPGIKAQSLMMPIPRPGHKDIYSLEDDHFKAGVLVLLYPWKTRLSMLLTKRTDRMFHHRAQISFPGGRQESCEVLETTALREAQEELGTNLEAARILGRLTPLYIPPSNCCVYPFVASIGERPDFHPSSEEVAEIIEVPIVHLLETKNLLREIWTIRGMEVEVPFYAYKKHKIWGATAMVLAEFLYVSGAIYAPNQAASGK